MLPIAAVLGNFKGPLPAWRTMIQKTATKKARIVIPITIRVRCGEEWLSGGRPHPQLAHLASRASSSLAISSFLPATQTQFSWYRRSRYRRRYSSPRLVTLPLDRRCLILCPHAIPRPDRAEIAARPVAALARMRFGLSSAAKDRMP